MKLYSHQKETLRFGLTRNVYADTSDPGTGKTIANLAVFSERLKVEKGLKALVLCPRAVIFDAWIKDAAHFNNIRPVAVVGTREQKLKAFAEEANLYVTNYETLNQPFNWDTQFFQVLIADEAVKLKNPQAKLVKQALILSRRAKYKTILSGLITPNTLLEIWSPFEFLQREVLGRSYWSFRIKYFRPNPFSYQGREWLPQPAAEKRIMDILNPMIIRHEKSKCLDMPEKVHSIREIQLSPAQMRHYKEFLSSMISKIDNVEITATTKVNMLNKLAQICSGFAYDNYQIPRFTDNSKLVELKDLLAGELVNEQVLIFYNFRAEVELFRQEFPDAAFIEGGQSSAVTEKAIADFKSGAKRLMFASIKAAKYGLTFTNAAYTIYFSLNYSLDDFYQSQDRTHRIGQVRTVNYIYLLTAKTVERRIYAALQKKQSLNDMLFELMGK
jgi:SNF2 family DNA or RNA helicase